MEKVNDEVTIAHFILGDSNINLSCSSRINSLLLQLHLSIASELEGSDQSGQWRCVVGKFT